MAKMPPAFGKKGMAPPFGAKKANPFAKGAPPAGGKPNPFAKGAAKPNPFAKGGKPFAEGGVVSGLASGLQTGMQIGRAIGDSQPKPGKDKGVTQAADAAAVKKKQAEAMAAPPAAVTEPAAFRRGGKVKGAR